MIGPTEAEFMGQIIEMAQLRGWRVHHTRPAWTGKGWRTPIQGDPGFPDLVLVRKRGKRVRVIFAELKSDKGRLTNEQQEWIRLLEGCKGVESYIWRPRIWEGILAILGYQEEIKNKEENEHG